MQGIILSGQNPPGEAEILSRIWVAGVIPFLVGVAIIINGLFVSKKIVELANRQRQQQPSFPETGAQPQPLRPADTSEFVHPGFSVTEGTTKHPKATSGSRSREPEGRRLTHQAPKTSVGAGLVPARHRPISSN